MSTSHTSQPCEREYDFALVVGGVPALTDRVQDALFAAGCDDATLSIQYGQLYTEFSRSAGSLKDAILSAIRDVHRAGIGARVLRVDECNLVTAAEVARRINRSRQLVHQYMTGQRGPGGFPPPVCYLATDACQSPLWSWCAVSAWLVRNGLLRPEESWNAQFVYAINAVLERDALDHEVNELVTEIADELRAL